MLKDKTDVRTSPEVKDLLYKPVSTCEMSLLWNKPLKRLHIYLNCKNYKFGQPGFVRPSLQYFGALDSSQRPRPLQNLSKSLYSNHLNTQHLKSKYLTLGHFFCPVFKWSDHMIRWTIMNHFCPVIRPPFENQTIWHPDTFVPFKYKTCLVFRWLLYYISVFQRFEFRDY